MNYNLFQVAAAFNRCYNTVRALWVKFQHTGSVQDLPRRPRQRVTTHRQDRYIILTHLRDRFRTATETARAVIGRHNRQIHAKTVRNRLKDINVKAYRPCKRPILTQRHKRDRFLWARRNLRLTRADWARILFVDETRLRLRHADGRVRVYRRRGERYAPNCVQQVDQYGGGSVMLWAGVSLHTKTPIVFIRGNMNAQTYQNNVLIPTAIPHIRANRGMSLAQDNATCHNARATQALLAASNIRLIRMPARSPDLNPIENIWDLLKRHVRQLPQQQNLHALRHDIVRTWTAIRQQYIQRYIISMRSRCRAVVAARGGHTRY